jgi:dihydrolipoamide dehydrogenase
MPVKTDIAIIGGGPGGYVAAIRAAQLGARVVLIEKDEVGGVCLNRGCIPTKALLHIAQVMSTVRSASELGIGVGDVTLDYSQVIRRKDQAVQRLVNGVKLLLKSNGVETIKAAGRLVSPQSVEVVADGQVDRVEARAVIVATGSVPARLPVPGADEVDLWDSDRALEATKVPSSILIVGAGAVGVEWATIFNSFGAHVTLVEMMPNVVPLEDDEVAAVLERALKRRGVDVLTNSKVASFSRSEAGIVSVVTTPEGERRVETEEVLIAVGRRPNTSGLGLEELGVHLNRGWVVVDDTRRTNVPGLYAIGDVTGEHLLAHAASHQGIVAAENILGLESRYDSRVVPACTFTQPEIASVGLREREARARGLDIKVGKFPFSANGKAITMGDTEGMVKIIADARTEEVLGLHIIGPEASSMIPEGVLAMALEATLEELARTIHVHPTLPEAIMEAAWAAKGTPIHIPPKGR